MSQSCLLTLRPDLFSRRVLLWFPGDRELPEPLPVPSAVLSASDGLRVVASMFLPGEQSYSQMS